jgi:hypothetical protein
MKQRKKITTWISLAPLPPVVLNERRLTPTDRLLLSLIIRLSKGKGYCFASNGKLATYVGCSPGTVSKSINAMCKLGFIVNNVPDPERGGRVFRRTPRADLISESQSRGNESSHSNIGNQPSEKAIQNYIKKQTINNNRVPTETEKKIVQQTLQTSVRDKWQLYQECKSKFHGQYPILWDVINIQDLVVLCNKLNQAYFDEFEKLPSDKKYKSVVTVFVLFIKSKPDFMKSCLPKSFVKYFNSIMGQQQFLSKVKNHIPFDSDEETYFT